MASFIKAGVTEIERHAKRCSNPKVAANRKKGNDLQDAHGNPHGLASDGTKEQLKSRIRPQVVKYPTTFVKKHIRLSAGLT
jgi:hypothetical protein